MLGTGRVFDRLRNAVAFIIVILLLLSLISVAANAQDSTSAPVVSSEWGKYVSVGVVPKGMMAVTVCQDGVPVVHFRAEDLQYQTEEATGELWAHEQVHVRQLEADGLPCEQNFSKIVASAASLTRAEAEATCAQAAFVYSDGGNAIYVINSWVEKFTAYLNTSDDAAWHITEEQAIRAIRANCPLLSSIYVSE
jgi:hypothetical protein